MAEPRILVMGVGNPLMRDEGAGPRTVEILMNAFDFPDNVEVVDCGTMGYTILDVLRGADHLIVVDALRADDLEPGEVVRLEPSDFAASQVMHSLHDIRLPEVLQAAALIGTAPTDRGDRHPDRGDRRVGASSSPSRSRPPCPSRSQPCSRSWLRWASTPRPGPTRTWMQPSSRPSAATRRSPHRRCGPPIRQTTSSPPSPHARVQRCPLHRARPRRADHLPHPSSGSRPRPGG